MFKPNVYFFLPSTIQLFNSLPKNKIAYLRNFSTYITKLSLTANSLLFQKNKKKGKKN